MRSYKNLGKQVRAEHYKDNTRGGEDRVRYHIAGETYDSFEDMKERGMSDADIASIEKELLRKHQENKILKGIKYPTQTMLELRKLERIINDFMSLFGMKQSGSIGTFPCFFGEDRCKKYPNGTVIWHNRGGGRKVTKKGTWRKSWTQSNWVEPYFKCLSCLNKVNIRDSIPVLMNHYSGRTDTLEAQG